MQSSTSKCSRCKRKEVFFHRVYSGERLCKKCFAESLENKVRATIIRFKMLQYSDHVALALSGGKDSLTLLEILAKMERNYPRAALTAVTVDEGIRGYRNEAMDIATAACRKLAIPHHSVSFKTIYGVTLDEIVRRTNEHGHVLTPCAFCGVLRRKALNIAATEVNANKIATGHTLDDEVQTSLLNIFHGDISRIAVEGPVTNSVHPRLVQKIKPLCEIPERESALYAYVKGFPLQSTPCPYAGEAMRNDIRNLLNCMEDRRAGTKYTISRSIERLRPAMVGFTEKGDFHKCKKCGEPTTGDECMACQLLKQIL